MMTKMRNQKIMLDANLQVAENVNKMAELGYFDVDFTMYGCAYQLPNNEKRYYRVSSQAIDIYDFMENAMQQSIYAGNIMTLSKRCHVPSGSKGLMEMLIKQKLAIELHDFYPREFFNQLYILSQYYRNDVASSLLWEEAELLEGVFDEEKLNKFEVLVHYIYSCGKIESTTYRQLLDWIKEERKNMNDNPICKDLFEKTLYGIAYEKDGCIFYIENAQREYIYKKVYELEQDGRFVTPVFSKTFWYNYTYRLSDVTRDFKRLLRKELDEQYCKRIKMMRNNMNIFKNDEFQNALKQVEQIWGEPCANTLKRYGCRWGAF